MGRGSRRERELTRAGASAWGTEGAGTEGNAPRVWADEMTDKEKRALLRRASPRRHVLGLSLRSAAGAICVAGAIVGAAAFLLPPSPSKSAPKPKAEAAATVAGQEVSNAFGQLASAEPSAGAAMLASVLTRREQVSAPLASERSPTRAAGALAPASAGPSALPGSAPVPQAAPASPGSGAAKAVDPGEAEALLKRSEAFVAQGDIASARLLLQRAANGGHARAALMLAGTYDPGMLRQLQVYGVPGDSAKAREWYEKAREFGAPEASGRLEVLARAGE